MQGRLDDMPISKDSPQPENQLELSIMMPCLNEAETLATCIGKARRFLETQRILGEIVIADNGSTDGSREIAVQLGARIVPVLTRGYGAALIGGIGAAHGKYVIMGDADDSYDFEGLLPFLEQLRSGADLVMGNRFQGGIEPGAMPFLHRYLGNPVLSFLGRLFFSITVGDFHCGLRGFNRERIVDLNLRTTGMEFASEMVVRSALSNYRIDEVPTTLRPDGRSRAPHLRTWRDGWRHLSFLLIYSPRWLFLYPGLALIVIGVLSALLLLPGPVKFGSISLDVHTLLVACIAVIVGFQSISFSVLARKFATSHNLMPPSNRYSGIISAVTLERILVMGGFLAACGLAGFLWNLSQWAHRDFGAMEYGMLVRGLMISMTATAVGAQLALLGFLSAIIEIPTK